jgi:hypothetical protein
MKNLNNQELKLVLYKCLWQRYQCYRQTGGKYPVHAWVKKDFIQEDIREIIDNFFGAVRFSLSGRQRRQLALVLAREMAVTKDRQKTVKDFCARILSYHFRLVASNYRDRVMWVAKDLSKYFPSEDLQEKFFAAHLRLELLVFQERHPEAMPYISRIENLPFLKSVSKDFLLICLLQREYRTFLQLWLRFSKKRLSGRRIVSSVQEVFKKTRKKKNKPNKKTPSS